MTAFSSKPDPVSRSAGGPIRVVTVDDSVFMRRALKTMLDAPGITVVGSATNGEEGIAEVARLRPDVVTLDIEMPVMDGLTALRKIRSAIDPAPAVLVCSSLTSAGSHEALKALRLGAADVIAKDSSTFSLSATKIRDELLAKVRAIAQGRTASVDTHTAAAPARIDASHRLNPQTTDVVVIGSSTGGPPVLEAILSALPANFPAPIVVAQHMPLMFTKSLAERLSGMCKIAVQHAEHRMSLRAGTAYIGPGGSHTRVIRAGLGKLGLEVSGEPADALYKPCVNELYSSAARVCGGRSVAVILTGMGDDGMLGAKDLRAKGATILAQDMQSCVVYGMPRAVAQAGLADGSMPPKDIAAVLATLAIVAGAKRAA